MRVRSEFQWWGADLCVSFRVFSTEYAENDTGPTLAAGFRSRRSFPRSRWATGLTSVLTQACRSALSPARLQISQPHARSRGRRNLGRPGGLRAGSPPSPPPRSIRPTVRRLLRSPRLSGPGPHQFWPLWLVRLGWRGGGHLGDRLKFRQELRPMLHQVADDPGVPEQLC